MGFDGIHIAGSGMAASQRALEVIGDNIANVGTPGHTRRRVELASTEVAGPSLYLGPGARGAGVTVVGVERVRDLVLDGAVRAELANSAAADRTAETLARIEEVLGPFDGGMIDALGAFWNSWEELSLEPTSMAARTEVLGSAERLGQMIRNAARGLEEAAAGDERTALGMLADQNAVLREVATLNGQILAREAMGENPNALLDQRDRHLDTLAAVLGARAHRLENGMVNVSVNGSEVVRGDVADRLELVGTPPVLQTSTGRSMIPGGAIGSLLIETRSFATQVGAELDTVATELRDLVNSAHTAGFDLAGNAGVEFFSGSGAVDLTVAAGLTASDVAASATGSANDGNNAVVLSGLRNEAGADGVIDEMMRGITARVGAGRATAEARAAMNESILTDVRNARSSVSGVNLDEEMTLLLQYQRSYEAAARVLTTVDEMFEVLINRTGLVGR